jgi:ribosomal protein S18 acetylase RimI-like enzyme
MILLPASEFTLEELTDAYNQTRTDYLIPMPMNPGRFQEYIALYDLDLPASRVAVVGESIVGLGMLGVRAAGSWITRLGVLPEGRRQGVGTAVLQALLNETSAKGLSVVWLEVIYKNQPAHELFLKFGFQPTRELVVARRPPGVARSMSAVMNARKIQYLQHDEVIELHCRRRERMNWLNEISTMRNVRRLAAAAIEDETGRDSLHEIPHLSGILVDFQNGAQGWVSYQATTMQLKRISVEVIRGEPARTTADLLEIMHRLHAAQDAVIENIPDDERWAGFQHAGYFEVYRRIEMVRELGAA